MRSRYSVVILLCLLISCQTTKKEEEVKENHTIRLVTLDPGHFHAALVQKTMYSNVDSVVHVYAPEGTDVQMHLKRIEGFNTRPEDATRWNEEVYTGADYFDKMLKEKAGNVVVISGNNQKKTEYIRRSLEEGMNVLADKPMAINAAGFADLKQAFATAGAKGLLLYDIMTERYEITTMLQREFSLLPEVFGTLQKGTPQEPAVTKESVHHFYKYVSGSVLTRPAWFMDVAQQGEGIVDVTTHLVDLVQWECFPEQVIDTTEINITNARRWTTGMTKSQFKAITKLDDFPDYLKKDVKDTVLQVYSNGAIDYQIKGVNARVSVTWAYQAPEGAGDTHYSIMRGTKANLVIRQGAEQKFKPVLYIEPLAKKDAAYEKLLAEQLKTIQAKFPGVELTPSANGWEVVIPEKYKETHEAHFSRVTEKFLEYLRSGILPAWEVPNMITKYYTTTRALEIAKKK
ncbi:Gfo/Idh/MocA family oxidoreductase [Fulvivirgaceae bacterium PWU4]|uniref:Gfo/Idh/MocA family oxidoreductase n=1 Tax=Chryseosolibacter histidini TaxID=2782349 RepID=A0AAP2DG67_9BACT|nr:putative oxidoreductase C-terminal domain-containing protein [Chryseosolibacter histidini]MBT1695625.1 Gfo/Idh/MocA family oxidoreductase [Chryseosolibacter histidini]